MKRDALIHGSAQPGGRPPAPPPLALVQGFVNTVDREHGPDLLDEPAGLAAWLAARELPGDADPERARVVREALRSLLWANAGAPADSAAAHAALHAELDAAAPRVRLDPPRLEPAAGDALGAVLAAAFAAMADGTWARLKACPGPRCGWAFYDRSVNRSATWCSMRVCGGRAKARAHYWRSVGST